MTPTKFRVKDDPWCCGAREIGFFYDNNGRYLRGEEMMEALKAEITQYLEERPSYAFHHAITNRREEINGVGKVLEECGFRCVARGTNGNNAYSRLNFYIFTMREIKEDANT